MAGAAAWCLLALTPVIGRRHELDELGRTLSRSRLVTLLGPGGVGKTRLAAGTARTPQSTGH
jgi:ATP-dependent Clp protease ATP-binding subunit ClpA